MSLSATRAGQRITAGETSAAVPFAGTAEDVARYQHFMVCNEGPYTVHLRVGNSDVEAEDDCIVLWPRSQQPLHKGQATHIAAIAIGGDQEILVVLGEGNMQPAAIGGEPGGSVTPEQAALIAQVPDKANTTDVDTALAAKADASALAAKANTTDVNTALAAKANTSDVNTALAAKADASALAAKANTTDVNTALAAKANTTDVNTALAAKADASALAAKANTTDVNTALAAKADASALAGKADISYVDARTVTVNEDADDNVVGFTVSGATFDTSIATGTYITAFRGAVPFEGAFFTSGSDATPLGTLAFYINPEGADEATRDATAALAFQAGGGPLTVSGINGASTVGGRLPKRSMNANLTSVYVGVPQQGGPYTVQASGAIGVNKLLRLTMLDADAARVAQMFMYPARNLANDAVGIAQRFVSFIAARAL